MTPIALMPASATSSHCAGAYQVSPMGKTPRSCSRPGTRIEMVVRTRLVRASTTVTESLLPLLTKTDSPATATPDGLLPPRLPSPNGRPVRTSVCSFGAAGRARSITARELDSGTFGTPRPGTSTGPVTVSRGAPAADSGEGKPKAGNGRHVSAAPFRVAPGTGLYSNMPMLVT